VAVGRMRIFGFDKSWARLSTGRLQRSISLA
jgi:hypothetical protein